jgi:hypothetical protein
MSIGIRVTAPALSRQMSVNIATTVYGRLRTYLTSSMRSPSSRHERGCGHLASSECSSRLG